MNSEFALIERLGRFLSSEGGPVEVGHPDDAAVIDLSGRAAVLAVDALVEGRHWAWELSTPSDVGWKAVAVNCSDVAAMGAQPVAAVVALQLPARALSEDVEALYAGMSEAAARWGVSLAGGDTVASDVWSVSLAILGAVDSQQAVRRRGAAPGDTLVCVGGLGAAAAGLAEARVGGGLDARAADPELLATHRRPRALVRAGQALARAGARAMIDVSDGLGADLGHLCRASQVSAVVEADALPISDRVRAAADRLGVDATELACGGEDLALLAALPADRAEEAVATAMRVDEAPGAVIGTVVPAGEPLVALAARDGVTDLSTKGYDHYGGGLE